MGSGEIVTSFRDDVKKSLVNTSLRHGILTSETSFVCLVKEGDDITRQIPAGKIILESRPAGDGIILKHAEEGLRKKKTIIYRPEESEEPGERLIEVVSPIRQKLDEHSKKNLLKVIVQTITPLTHVTPGKKTKETKEEKKVDTYSTPKTAKDIKKDLFEKLNRSSTEKSFSMRSDQKVSPGKRPKDSKATSPRATPPIPETLPYLLRLQQIKGYWEPQMVIGTLLGANLSALMKKMPKELREIPEKDKVWLTILVLVWIRHYSIDETTYEANLKKAIDWLEEKGDNLADCFGFAKTVLGF